MNKIYVLTVVCLALAFTGSAQKFYWVGASGASWNNSASWSLVSGGTGGAGTPHLATDSAVFNSAASALLSSTVDLATLTITNNSSVKITGSASGSTVKIIIHGTNVSTPGFSIAAGSTLECDAAANTEFITDFAAGSQGSVSGEWIFSGDDGINAYPYFEFLGAESGTRLNINSGGKMTASPLGFIAPGGPTGHVDLVFKAGSTLDFQGDNVEIPAANYDAASTILIHGITSSGVSFEEVTAIGNLTFSCGTLTTDVSLGLYDINVKGDLLIQNTNGQVLTLIGQRTVQGATTVNVGINGNLIITGNSSVAEMSQFDDKTTNLTVQGDFSAGGVRFDLQTDNDANLPTNLIVKKAFSVSSGTFGVLSTAVNENLNLFNVEFNGSVAQDVSSASGSIDNNLHQVTMRMNNALGVNLGSNFAVGRINFATANKGIIRTNAYTLTVNNTSGNANVVNGYGSNAYVEGSVARVVKSTNPAIFPTGLNGSFRKFTLTPNNNATNTFTVKLTSGNNGGTPVAPIAGESNYYWTVGRTGTSSATVSMDLAGAEPGRSSTDTLVAAAYNGSNWLDARAPGNFIFPGNSSSGTVTSTLQSSFSAFSIGYIINAALPIRLLSFTGRKLQNTAALAWEITENSTAVKFEVVRSADGVSFVYIGSLRGEVGKLSYSFTDNSLASGNNFYRLKMFDKDGSITYSNIIVVMNGSTGVLISSIMPTLVRDRAKLQVSSSMKGNMQLVVTDISGRTVQNQVVSIDAGNQEVWLNAGSLSSGMFQVTGYINGEKTATFRFIKQ